MSKSNQTTTEELTDTSIMYFGKYKGRELQDVPAQYLLWIHEFGNPDRKMRDYIEDNMDVLKKEMNER